MAIGPQNNYPSLALVANLVRSLVDDDKRGATSTPGEGQILTNSSVTLQNFMNSAIREACRDVRISGQLTLIRDNALVLGLTPVNSSLGIGCPNPATQVSLQFTGYFDGLQMNSALTLPSDLLEPLEAWERAAGTEDEFVELPQAAGALHPLQQTGRLGRWEWRGGAMWMNGATQSRDLRLRYVAKFLNLATANVDWDNTFIPIMDCEEAVADKIVVRYAARLGSDSLQYALDKSRLSTLAMKQQATRDRQKIDFQRPSFRNR